PEIVESGNLSQRLLGFTTLMLEIASLPFALALGIDLYTMTEKLGGRGMGLAVGIGTTMLALLLWVGWEYGIRMRQGEKAKKMPPEKERLRDTPLDEKIDTVLSECRVVIPGAQALLGFLL